VVYLREGREKITMAWGGRERITMVWGGRERITVVYLREGTLWYTLEKGEKGHYGEGEDHCGIPYRGGREGSLWQTKPQRREG
jgi:hypothetical protein